MNILTFGSKNFTAQLPRICEGFKELGHTIVENDCSPDLIYCNDSGGFDGAIEWTHACQSTAPPMIFNVLDIPEHLFPNYDLKKLEEQLNYADIITSISKATQEQLQRFLRLDSKIIYQPSMPVFQTNQKKYDYKYLILGRNSDRNKRNDLARDYLHKFESNTTLAVLGSESWSYGDYFGVVSNEILNDFYNSVDYVFSLTKYGGIELSQIEAILAGKFPIVCNDSAVAWEFNPEFACEPTPEGIRAKILEIEENSVKYKEIVENKQIDFREKFSQTNVAGRILELIK